MIRKGIEGDKYIMIWTNVCWGVATLFGVFAGLWAMPRFGSRIMLQIGLAWFALGNLLCRRGRRHSHAFGAQNWSKASERGW